MEDARVRGKILRCASAMSDLHVMHVDGTSTSALSTLRPYGLHYAGPVISLMAKSQSLMQREITGDDRETGFMVIHVTAFSGPGHGEWRGRRPRGPPEAV